MTDKEIILKYFSSYVDMDEEDGYIFLYRFSKEQRDFYESESGWFGHQSRCPAGAFLFVKKCGKISFDFYSNQEGLESIPFNCLTEDGVSKTYNLSLSDNKGKAEFDFGGKDVKIYFPYAIKVGFKNFVIEGEAEEKNDKKIFCFGDSITQGYYTEEMSSIYPSRLGRKYNVEAFNFGVGGYFIRPGILNDKDLLGTPEFITFAYGTNDWFYENDFTEGIKTVFDTISERYKGIPVFIILPLPRRVQNDVKKGGTLEDVRQDIIKAAEGYENFHVLRCAADLDFDKHLSADGVHPNNEGLKYFADDVLAKIEDILKY